MGWIAIARSWLKPALAVQRSALAPMIARQFDGFTVSARLESTGDQVMPSLPLSRGWPVVAAWLMPVPLGMKCNVRRVGEYGPSPAPARICALAGCGLLVFQTRLTLYVVAVIGSAH